MNMASIGILLVIFSVIYIRAGNANNGFINVQCKTENVVQYGQQSLLECIVHRRQEVTDAKIVLVTWEKVGDEQSVLFFKRGEFKLLPGYSFAEPSWNDKNMNVSLLISNTTVEHEGVYKCVVVTDSGDNSNSISLKVTARYNAPTIKSTSEKMILSTGGNLTCESGGGYPQGSLRWFDEHGEDWTRSSDMDMALTEKGLFNLSSKLRLLRGSVFSKYTCTVFNASGGKEAETTFEVPDVPENQGQGQGTKLGPASKIVAPVVVIGSLIAGLLMALLFYKRRSQQDRRPSTAPLMGGHQEVCTFEADVENGGQEKMGAKCQDSQD